MGIEMRRNRNPRKQVTGARSARFPSRKGLTFPKFAIQQPAIKGVRRTARQTVSIIVTIILFLFYE
jgi:hypothetical protein